MYYRCFGKLQRNYYCTSDSSWEGVGKLFHVFSLCLCLVLLPSEDNLNSTLSKTQTDRALSQMTGKGEER